MILPTEFPHRAGLLVWICRTTVKVPTIPREWGPWLQMTSAQHIDNTTGDDTRSYKECTRSCFNYAIYANQRVHSSYDLVS